MLHDYFLQVQITSKFDMFFNAGKLQNIGKSSLLKNPQILNFWIFKKLNTDKNLTTLKAKIYQVLKLKSR